MDDPISMDDQIRRAPARPRKAQPGPPTPKATTTGTTPAKRAPRKAATKVVATEAVAAEVLDDKLLAHLDAVLADMEAPVVMAPLVASPQPPRAPLWARVAVDPGFTAEHLAREAVWRLGPPARDWVDRTRTRYPGARPDALARLAVAEHVRAARLQAMTNTTIAGSLANVGTLARTHARLILTVAAAYGVDPTAEARVVDLLELLPVPRLTQPTVAAASNVGRVLGAIAVRRIAARVAPFGASIAGAIHSGRSTEDLARRAVDRFRPKR
jgi:hypothetical protein